ncbi:2'-5' RNA ligase [Halarchaeum rubridurum]|uniref:RNA 2',3'-cyclic phosphodiesterase n=1 Tax=Halarchaeum rubridurum TaxID=489911 RepID=A0A830FKF7_9EURY|nr:RNA 2',3'-cyclic phosphodiesterase [Halarchaeum rubridurum]MBP1954349.1 2'-5' RNA ligase [Halarchaeum rubridurum]GGM59348.1 RNA 2',3'-cyclic phosphodiesterase [Halarchaeum rubridurum]
MRLFVSVDLPESLVESVRALQAEFADADGLDFVDPAQAHVTLKFLGEVEESAYAETAGAVERAVERSRVGPFDAAFGGLGVFPSLDYVSVLWLGIGSGAVELAALHEAVERECVAAGFDPAGNEFTPHVTLARMKHGGGKELVQRLVRERDPDVGTARVTDVRLTESTLTHEGPEYETRERFALGK